MSALRPNPPQRARWVLLMLVAIGTITLVRMLAFYASQWHKQMSYSEFFRLVEEHPGEIAKARLVDDRVEGQLKNGTSFSVFIPPRDEELLKALRKNVPTFDVQPPQAGFMGILMALSPWIIFLGIMWLVMRSAQGGGRLLSFGKSRARLISPETHTRVTFDDVAGIEEAKEELREIIEFLKDPKRFQRLGGKIPKGVLLIGLPGTGKCVAGDTVVLTNKGPLEIRDIPKAFAVDEDNRVWGTRVSTLDLDTLTPKRAAPSHWYCLGEQPTLTIRTRLGQELEGTHEHPIGVLDTDGRVVFKRLEELQVGDWAAIRYNDQLFGTDTSVDADTAYLLGLLAGDGGATIKNRISFTTAAPELLEFVKTYCKTRYGYTLDKATGQYDWIIGNRTIKEDLLRYGLRECCASGKHVPEWVWLSTKPAVVAFLQGLFDTDGYVDWRGYVGFSSASQTLVRQVSTMLLNLGVVNRVWARFKRYNGHRQYYLEISGDFLAAFQAEVGFRLARKRQVLAKYLADTGRNTNVKVVPHQQNRLRGIWQALVQGGVQPYTRVPDRFYKNFIRYAEGVRNPSVGAFRESVSVLEQVSPSVRDMQEWQWLKSLSRADVFFTPLEEIRNSRAVVYDFTVPEGHNFVANGFVNHNTLLAKAVAGEANVPFYSISGSDFVEMFVGVGASRVRDLFEQARRNARQGGKGAIVFIDEIDAVGRQRFAGIGGGHDEREQTLNALLVEMDGFDTQEGIILCAATNRPDVLDPALLRPGRFDRQVVISLPDINGREAILKVHTRKIRLGKDVDLKSIARQTPGFSGADLANLANEAALLAARLNKDVVTVQELEKALERVIAGPERKTRVLNEREKRITAFHESGHALVALLTPSTDPVHKVSIIPRGAQALGYTMQLPLEDRYTMSRNELIARITVMMGGRAAEEIIFSEITTGAQNDIETATDLARRMVCEFGMSDRLGTLTYGKRERQMFLGRDLFEERNYSEQTAVLIDEEVRRLVDSCYQRARQLLSDHRETLDQLATRLLEKEVLDGEEVKRLVGLPGSNAHPAAPSPDATTPSTPSASA